MKREDLIGLVLYWGEGTKKARVEFTNSDPKIVKDFMKFLCRQNIDKKRLRARVQSSRKNIDEEAKKYWSAIINIPLNQFIKSRIRPGRAENSYRGSITIRYNSKLLLQKILDKSENIGNLSS